MGLGKTLTMISLVLDAVNNDKENTSDSSSSDSDDDQNSSWIKRGRSKSK